MSIKPVFLDRHAAGVALVPLVKDAIAAARGVGHAVADAAPPALDDVIALGMARGGVAVAVPIARALAAPLEVFVGRKFGVPGVDEVAFGAIAEGGFAPVLDGAHAFIGIPRTVVRSVFMQERDELTLATPPTPQPASVRMGGRFAQKYAQGNCQLHFGLVRDIAHCRKHPSAIYRHQRRS